MSYESESARVGREPISLVELDMDFCQYLFGETQTNRLQESENFANTAVWFRPPNTNLVPGATVSPRGDATGWLLSANDVDNAYLQENPGTFTATNQFASLFVKYHSAEVCYLGIHDATSSVYLGRVKLTWNPGGAGGELSVESGTVIASGSREWADGWYQIWLVTDTATAGHTASWYFHADEIFPATGRGTYLWGGSWMESADYAHYVSTEQGPRTHGCSAVLGSAGRCFNTRNTCQAALNYTPLKKTTRFCERLIGCAPPGLPMIPSVVSIAEAPARLDPGLSLGYRASVSVTLADHTHHDRGIDPYVDTRSIDPETSGTFWTKFLARNAYFMNRTLRIKRGYIRSPWNWLDFKSHSYVIERIDGPDSSETVTITGKDVLKLADNSRVKIPKPTDIELTYEIDEFATSVYMSPYEAGERFSQNEGYARIDDEIVGYVVWGVDATATTTRLRRGLWGTTAAYHAAGAQVQECIAAEGINVVSFIRTLLTEHVGIPLTLIDNQNWQALEQNRLAVYRLTGIQTEPIGLNTLLSDLMAQCQIALWWDEIDQLLKMRELSLLETDLPQFTDADSIIAGSVKLRLQPDLKRTQVWFYYTPADATSGELSNYRRVYLAADADIEAPEKDGDERVELIEARWLDNNTPAIAQSATRLLNRRTPTPRLMSFSIDVKDEQNARLADIVEIATRYYTDELGVPITFRGMVISAVKRDDDLIDLDVLSGFGQVGGTIVARPIIIGPNSLLDYSAESAANKENYSFISPTDTEFSDGSDAYRIT